MNLLNSRSWDLSEEDMYIWNEYQEECDGTGDLDGFAEYLMDKGFMEDEYRGSEMIRDLMDPFREHSYRRDY
jgi:hypothetical protein